MGKESNLLETKPSKRNRSYERWIFSLTLLFFLVTSVYFIMENREKDLQSVTISERILSVEAAVLGEIPEDEMKETPKLLEGETININTAGLSDLQRLPNIGPSRAEDIITYRNTQGAFIYKEELMLIEGIGEATFENIAKHITLE